jgi:hypothetical protein
MSGTHEGRLDPATLIAKAVETTGIDDEVGDSEFLECLSAFCAAVRTEARLPASAIDAAEADVVRTLANRLRFHRDLEEHPEILDEVLEPPIVIMGLPRTGTTKLQRILSEDPGVQRLDFWKILNPSRVPLNPDGSDPRIEFAQTMQEGLVAAFPDFMAAHPLWADSPDEDLQLMEFTFDAYVAPLRYRVPTFRDRILARSARPAYFYAKRLLQYLQWQDGGARARPWILKTPVHIGHLPLLLEAYPGATLVHCHRDPRVVIPSFVRLVELLHGMRTPDRDLDLIREQTVDYWSAQVSQNLRDRDAGYGEHVLDVSFEAIREDIDPVLERIYRASGRTLAPEARKRFAAWQQDDLFSGLGSHEYSLERYGLSRDMIAERFADYIDRFITAPVGGV